MKLQFGTILRRLRRDRELTQEELAEVLNVSTQSVSRWETGACYPDMELLPVIASFFETTVDQLLGVTQAAEAQKVAAYLERFQAAISVGDISACIEIARAGAAEFPGNFQLLNKLMYALFASGSSDADIPDWQENMQRYDGEIVSLGERIMKYCPDQEIRLEATARLAFQHCEMGRRAQGRAVYETLPALEYCKENQIWWGLEEDEKLPHARRLIRQGFSAVSAGMFYLIEDRLLPDADLIRVFERKFALDRLIWGEVKPKSGQHHCEIAAVYARLNMPDEALEQLEIAAEAVLDFDRRPNAKTVNTLLLGNVTIHRTDYETADSRPLRRIMAETWMQSPDFDGVRETPEFQAILSRLQP